MNAVASCAKATTIALLVILFAGCGPSYQTLRRQGMNTMVKESYGSAKWFFLRAEEKSPGRVANLHDLGTCYVMLAKNDFEQKYYAAAMRDVDNAIAYFTRAIDVHPGHQPSIEGKSTALRLKGQFDAALANAEWAAEFVGPAAVQFIFLAEELEESGDLDGAFLRYRQAVAVEPNNAKAHRQFAKFLLRRGNERAAVHHLREAYLIEPTNKWVMQELASRGALPYLTSDPEPGS